MSVKKIAYFFCTYEVSGPTVNSQICEYLVKCKVDDVGLKILDYFTSIYKLGLLHSVFDFLAVRFSK